MLRFTPCFLYCICSEEYRLPSRQGHWFFEEATTKGIYHLRTWLLMKRAVSNRRALSRIVTLLRQFMLSQTSVSMYFFSKLIFLQVFVIPFRPDAWCSNVRSHILKALRYIHTFWGANIHLYFRMSNLVHTFWWANVYSRNLMDKCTRPLDNISSNLNGYLIPSDTTLSTNPFAISGEISTCTL